MCTKGGKISVCVRVKRRKLGSRQNLADEGGENMIDDILHSVEDAEKKAADTVKRAKEQSAQIASDAKTEADQLKDKGRKLFELESRERRRLTAEEEAVKDEVEKAAVLEEIMNLQEEAKKKESQIVTQLIAELVV